MDPDAKESPLSEPLILKIASRLLAATSAVAICYLLYRLVKAYYSNGQGSRRLTGRRALGSRKNIYYTQLSDGEEAEAETEGYRDSSTSNHNGSIPPSPLLLNRPLPELPDKPLPPLPEGD